MPSPADLRQTAAGLRAQADGLPSALDSVAAHAGPDVWRGPAADRFIQELEEQRRRLRAVADELHMAARRYDADATLLEATVVEARVLDASAASAAVPPRFS